MDNTVGSRGIEDLTKRQKAILIGKILGDGTLEKNGNYSRLRVCQGYKQREYVYWLYKEFKNFATKKPRLVKLSSYRKASDQFRFDTYSLSIFDKYRKLFYNNRKKIIPVSIYKILNDPISLAVWYMDDGYKRTDNSGLYLCSFSFTNKENLILKDCLFDNFGLEANIHFAGKYARLHIPSRSIRKFVNYISQYLVKCMFYKIGDFAKLRL